MKFVILILACLLSISKVYAESPRQFAERFYRGYQKWNIRGVPSSSQRHLVSGYFGTGPLRLFRAVEDQRSRERAGLARRNRGNPNPPLVKPLWCAEGDWLSSTDEGITTYAIGRPFVRHGRVNVPAYLEFGVGKAPYRWTDYLVLDRAGDSWVVADIRFEDGKSLMSGLTEELADNEPYLRSFAERTSR